MRDGPNGEMNLIIPHSIFESFNHLFIGFFFGNHAPEPFDYIKTWRGTNPRPATNYSVLSVFDKRTGELSLMNQPIKGQLGFKNDIDNGPVIWPQYISSNNEMITHISVEDFLEYYNKSEKPTPQLAEIAGRIKEDDNQIIIVAKLKD